MPCPFPCSPVIREWLCKKTQIEKKICCVTFVTYLLRNICCGIAKLHEIHCFMSNGGNELLDSHPLPTFK